MNKSQCQPGASPDTETQLIGRTGEDHLLIFCPHCQNFGLLFGNVRLDLSGAALRRLADVVDLLVDRVTDDPTAGAHRYYVGLGSSSLALSLRAGEVLDLQELLRYGLHHNGYSAPKAEVAELCPENTSWIH
ncbi:MAG: hypothetical protein MPN21_12400 [Thermoanaerobaculia bacterium]|nr:hypothetical protein [Thermoanaerobaculia bacterium]